MSRITTSAASVHAKGEGLSVQKDAILPRSSKKPSLSVAMIFRQQTPEEEGRFHAALHVLLSEIVREFGDRQ